MGPPQGSRDLCQQRAAPPTRDGPHHPSTTQWAGKARGPGTRDPRDQIAIAYCYCILMMEVEGDIVGKGGERCRGRGRGEGGCGTTEKRHVHVHLRANTLTRYVQVECVTTCERVHVRACGCKKGLNKGTQQDSGMCDGTPIPSPALTPHQFRQG